MRKDSQNTQSRNSLETLENLALSVSRGIGSVWSLIIHTLIFLSAFTLILLGINVDRVLLVLTTLVSLEAIYLSIFIQMSVNKQAQAIASVEKDIDEIAEDVEGIQEDVTEIAEDVEEIAEDVEGIQEDVTEIAEDVEEIAEDVVEMQENIDEIQEDVEGIQEDVTEDYKKNQKEIKKV